MVGSGGLAAPPPHQRPLTAAGVTALSAGKERTGANVALPLRRTERGRAARRETALTALESVGLAASAGKSRGSSPVACSSGWRSPGRWLTTR